MTLALYHYDWFEPPAHQGETELPLATTSTTYEVCISIHLTGFSILGALGTTGTYKPHKIQPACN